MRICRSWSEGCAAAGLPCHGDLHWEDVFAARREIGRLYSVGRITTDEWCSSLASALHSVYSPAEVWRINQAWLLGEYPGVSDLISRIHAAGVETACLSNTNDGHWNLMLRGSDRHGAPAGPVCFPAVQSIRTLHASHLLGVAKPDPAIYRAFEARTGFAGPEIIFFDDLQENVDAAAALNWRTGLIDHTGDTAAQMARTLAAHAVPGF